MRTCRNRHIILCTLIIADTLFLAFIMIVIPAHPSDGVIIAWEKIMGTSEDDYYGYVASDGKYIYVVGGKSRDSNTNIFVAKLDANGNKVWQIEWGYGGLELPSGISIYNNIIYVSGWIYNSTKWSYDIFMLGIDTNGNIIWQSTWDSNLNDMMTHDLYWAADRNIYACDKGIFVVGTTEHYGITKIAVLRYSHSGELIWETTWRDYSKATSIYVDQDRIYVLGTTSSGYNKHTVVLIYNLNGTLTHTIEYEKRFIGKGIVVYNGEIFLCGHKGETTAIILKSDTKGNIGWIYSYSEGDGCIANDILIHKKSLYIAGDIERSGLSPHPEIFIAKITLHGKKVWLAKIKDDDQRSNPHISISNSHIYTSGRIVRLESSGDIFITDLQIDDDLDGLSNIKEKELGTDPYNRDTDGDMFWDGTETFIHSDPKNKYTPLAYFIAIIIPPLTNIIICLIKNYKHDQTPARTKKSNILRKNSTNKAIKNIEC